MRKVDIVCYLIMCSSVMLGMVGIDMWEWSVLTCWVWSVLTCGKGGQCLITCSSVVLGMVGIDIWELSVLTCWVWSVLTCGRCGQCLIFGYVFLSDVGYGWY